MTVQVRRIYDDAADGDGTRVLVDRVWPRGVRKDDPRYDEWIKDVAPSAELRKWYGHDPDRFDEFRRRYRAELATHRDSLDALRKRAGQGTLTLVFAARDPEHSSAAALRDVLLEQ